MRRSIGVLFLAVGCFILGVASAAAQQPNAPGAVTASPVGDTEVTVSWTTPAPSGEPIGEGDYEGGCDTTDYFVRVRNLNVYEDVAEVFVVGTSYTMGVLTGSNTYEAAVWTYSAQCDDYSASPATVTFTTGSASGDGDPVPDTTPLLSPRAATDVTVTVSGTQAGISWTAPVDSSNHCDVLDYSVQLHNVSDGSADDIIKDYITGTSATVDGVTAGDTYRVFVWAYSEECDAWSPAGEARIN